MTVFIFPKLFEVFKFLSSLFENPSVVVLDIRQKDECEFVVTVWRHHFEQDCYFAFRILLINDSDINFYGIFSKMLVDKTESGYEGGYNPSYLLIGSCGSSDPSDLGKVFLVDEAIKGDRGKLDETQRFEWDPEKETKRTHKFWDTEIHALQKVHVEKKKTCSTNFINDTIIDKRFEGFLFDMETYDFYDICEKNQIKTFSCLRFVTDYVLPLNTKVNLKDYFQLPYFKQTDIRQLLVSESKQERVESKQMKKMKKMTRLQMKIDFDFIFALNLDECKCSERIMFLNATNVEKFYMFFLDKYRAKIQMVGGSCPDGALLLSKNQEKYRDYVAVKKKQKEELKRKRQEENFRSRKSKVFIGKK
jgi:hypothetical protein